MDHDDASDRRSWVRTIRDCGNALGVMRPLGDQRHFAWHRHLPVPDQLHARNRLVKITPLRLLIPEGAKTCGDDLLVRHSFREKAQTLGKAIQGGDGGFSNGRIIEWKVLLDQGRDECGSLRGKSAAPDGCGLTWIHLQGSLLISTTSPQGSAGRYG
jgi:hypothetical protein